VDVRPPADWVPRLVAPELYRPRQEKARAELRAALTRLIE
jgi:hypothetical protein